jgi:peptide/nickel transport system ATP-binding protein
MTLLKVENLAVSLNVNGRQTYLIDHISFEVSAREIVCLVGESGCGKSTTALALMRLLSPTTEMSGAVYFEGHNLLDVSEAQMCRMRGARIAMVFQEPMTALNPVKKIGDQIMEPLFIHQALTPHKARARALDLLARVGIADPATRLDHFPHQLSGGQRQRVVIAIALACKPDIIVADEPTTALDTTVQRQILDLLVGLVEETGIGLILITHNLAIVSEIADRVLVMYGGRIVEEGRAEQVFAAPAHPYTWGLLAALPLPDREPGTRLRPIPGNVPRLGDLREGCAFASRCAYVVDRCRRINPALVATQPGHHARCIRIDEPLSAGAVNG